MTDWTLAACLGHPEHWDPARQPGESAPANRARVRAALHTCRHECPIVADCLAAHLTDQWLIVGGTTPTQRHARRRRTA